MPKGYWMVHVDVTDPESFASYAKATALPFAKHGARFLARAGRFEAIEGEARSRNTIIEFPSYDDAVACWGSPEYQEVRRLRLGAATVEIVIVEGYEGAQPQAT